jgi:hypothetical protein
MGEPVGGAMIGKIGKNQKNRARDGRSEFATPVPAHGTDYTHELARASGFT